MAHYSSDPYKVDSKVGNAIDRKRERERFLMLNKTRQEAERLSTLLVQRLVDEKILETGDVDALRELVRKQMERLADLEDFDIQFKIAPLRGLVKNPNFVSLFLTQYIVEDLIDHPKVTDIFGDDEAIYKAVDSVMDAVRPR